MGKAIVLGAGMVGTVIARDLAVDGDLEVTIADVDPKALAAVRRRTEGRVHALQTDCADPKALAGLVAGADVVVGALASRLGFRALRAVIEAGRNYCDISFMSEDALELDALARERGVTAVVDCGVAPGMSNMIAGYEAARLERTDAIELYVGGVPQERRWPFEYKAGFSPYDVIEEYTRPARLVEHGRVVVREALSEPEMIEVAGIGTLEAFNTDGLRTLVTTLDVPFMKEKTLRYPGHRELMRVFRATGLFSREPVLVHGHPVKPVDLLAAVLFPRWTFGPGEGDVTVFRAIARGFDGTQNVAHHWNMIDRYDVATATTSMARTTAFPCAIVARMLARGDFQQPGVLPPEVLGRTAGVFEHVRSELRERGVVYEHRVEVMT